MNLIVIDLFCGAGGTTTGFDQAQINGQKVAKVIVCVNHDEIAIASHEANHPEVLHMHEKIQQVHMEDLQAALNDAKRDYPDARVVLWASLECTNFSKAKGGLPRDADSRSLADYMPWYVKMLRPDYVMIENVVEFMSWGPLDDNGKPLSKKTGTDYVRWIAEMQSLNNGYSFDWKELNSANYGAYTSRNRFFAIFAHDGLPIVWPESTHAKIPKKAGMFGGKDQEKWRAVRDVLDLENVGNSIFTRSKPLSEKTLERIYAGLIKFVAGGKEAFLIQYYGNSTAGAIGEPCGTITTKDRFALVNPAFITQRNSGNPNSKVVDVNGPARTITGTGGNQDVVTPLLLNYNSSTAPVTDTVQPAPTITAARTHYIINPQWFNTNPLSVDEPWPTLVARMDKVPHYLVVTEAGELAIEVYTTDSPMTVKIKEFMAMYSIADICMRMLTVAELLRIQGFPSGYVLKGNQNHQKKFIGNSVVPLVVQRMAEALAFELQCMVEELVA